MRAMVTGAAAGLGRALTEELLEQGFEVVAVDLDTDSLEDLAVSSRGACQVFLADMANPDSLERLLSGFGSMTFDLVILNAGTNATGKFEEIPSAAYGKLISVNLNAPLILASSLVGRGFMAGKSKIVFISSLSHVVGYPGASVYAATKEAISVYAKSVKKPFKKQGVGVLTVYPGPVRTAHAEKFSPAGAKAEKRMPPDKLAGKILKAAKSRKTELYPGFTAELAKLIGNLAPNFITKRMRSAIFDKLEGPVY